jgi:hypothetical protein
MSQDLQKVKKIKFNNGDSGGAQQKQEKWQHGQRFETLSG